ISLAWLRKPWCAATQRQRATSDRREPPSTTLSVARRPHARGCCGRYGRVLGHRSHDCPYLVGAGVLARRRARLSAVRAVLADRPQRTMGRAFLGLTSVVFWAARCHRAVSARRSTQGAFHSMRFSRVRATHAAACPTWTTSRRAFAPTACCSQSCC